MADKRLTRISPALRGATSRYTDTEMPEKYAQQITNLLLDRPDRLVMRGSITGLVTYDAAAARSPIGAVVFDNKILTGQSAAAHDYTILGEQPTAANLVPNITRTDLDTAGTAVMAGAFGTTDDFCPGLQRSARLGTLAYYLTALTTASAARAITGATSINSRRVASWDGTNAGTPIVVRNTGPMYAVDLAAYAERLFVLGGTVPNAAAGAGTYNSDALYYSDPGGPTTDTLALWQDDVSGLANQLNVGDRDAGDFGVGLCQINNGLVIFKRHSIWVLRGSGPQTFQIRCFTRSLGCCATESIVPYMDGCIFASDQGMYYFDGSQITRVLDSIDEGAGPVWAGTRCVQLSPSYYLISAPYGGDAYLWYAPTDSWSVISHNASLARTDKVFVATANRYAVALDGHSVFDYSRVVRTGGPGLTTQVYGRDKTVAGVQYGVPVVYQTRAAVLGSPGDRAQLSRAIVDYRVRRTDAAASSVDFIGTDATADDVAAHTTSTTIPSDTFAVGDTTNFNRTTVDIFTEADSYSVYLGYTCPAAMDSVMFGNVYIEAQGTHQSRTRFRSA